MLLRVQIALSLFVLLGLATLAQVVVAARTLGQVLGAERAAEAAVVADVLAGTLPECRGEALCEERRLVEATRSHALDWAGLYRSGRRVAGQGPEARPEPDARTVVRVSGATAVAVRPKPARELTSARARQRALVGVILLTGAAAFFFSLLLLERAVLRPVRALTEAAERASRLEAGPFAVAGTGPVLRGLAGTLDRMMAALEAERERTRSQVDELAKANEGLARARDSLVVSEKLATVGSLAAGVAHEVGNPLSAILGYLDLGRTRADPDNVKECLDRIEAEIRRIDGTVRGLLSFARPDAIRLGPTSVEAVVDAAVRLASMPTRMKGVEVVRDIPEDLPLVLAEEQRLAQVLVNLLFNAADAMGGRGRVEIRARAVESGPARRASDPPPGRRVAVTVADEGPGIAPENLPRIFDPFFTTKGPGEGTGLGLAICHRILETFGGEIRAANREGRGAELTLLLMGSRGQGSGVAEEGRGQGSGVRGQTETGGQGHTS